MRRHSHPRDHDGLPGYDDSFLVITSMLTVCRISADGAESQPAADLRPPNAEDWHKWKPSIMARYKAIPARLFIREMEVEGLRVTWV